MKREGLAAVLAATAMLLGVVGSAGAVDGTIEINQAKVLAQGGSFPYTIGASGSYRLTGNLTVPAGGGFAIVVNASNVTIGWDRMLRLAEGRNAPRRNSSALRIRSRQDSPVWRKR